MVIMNTKFKALLIISIALLFYTNNYAQKYSNEFLSIGVGARAQGMGNAVVAGVDDVTAGFWNPAGLANIGLTNGFQAGAMHSEWFAGIGKYDYLSATKSFDDNKRFAGISLIRFGIDDIPNTLSLYEDDGTVNYDNIVPFSAADYALLLSYAQVLKTSKGKLTFGGNVKLVHRRIGPFANAWGVGLDAGLQYHIGKWKLGFMAKDVTGTYNAWSFKFTDDEKEVLELTNNEIPINSVEVTKPQILLGGGRYFQLKEKIGLYTELNARMTTDGQRNTLLSAKPFSIDPTIGAEFNYNQWLFLRLGANNFQQDTDIGTDPYWTVEPTLGLGLKISKLKIDYAFTDVAEQRNNTYSHVISVILTVGE